MNSSNVCLLSSEELLASDRPRSTHERGAAGRSLSVCLCVCTFELKKSRAEMSPVRIFFRLGEREKRPAIEIIVFTTSEFESLAAPRFTVSLTTFALLSHSRLRLNTKKCKTARKWAGKKSLSFSFSQISRRRSQKMRKNP